ncbi:hypothetical protein ACLB2K_075211 [Fragaria x ananassa]
MVGKYGEFYRLQVIKLMQSFKSKEYVRETFAWKHYYWYLTNEGIEHFRTYLNLPSEIVPATLTFMSQDTYLFIMFSDSPLFEARSRFGDSDGYQAFSGQFGGDKEGAPAQFQPYFRLDVCNQITDTLFDVLPHCEALVEGLALAAEADDMLLHRLESVLYTNGYKFL